ncbi:hypothetical protein G6F31_021514 [Rhizopus arrhizus]|nr:hypothetical protein G6F31_021514 [Rhizopus arrhizus]
MVPVHLPLIRLGTYCLRCASDPTVNTASITPSVSMGHKENARLAAWMFSPGAAATSLGRPCPPQACGCCKPCQPPAA